MSTSAIKYFETCISCESHDLTVLPRYAKDFLCQCNRCGLIFSKRIPSLEELNEVYDNYSRSNSISEITIKRYQEILGGFEKYKKTGKILDVGAGDGFFLEVAKRRGWEVYGTEYDDRAITLCRQKGIKTYKGKLNIDDFEENFFDVVTSFEVMEHINNPNEDLDVIRKILRKGGVFYVTTPNFNGISRRYQGDKWTELCYPEHITYYTARTLSNVVIKHGFKTVWTKTTGIAISRTYDGAVAGGSIQEQKIREKSESNKIIGLAKDMVNWLLNLFKIGDALKALFVKE